MTASVLRSVTRAMWAPGASRAGVVAAYRAARAVVAWRRPRTRPTSPSATRGAAAPARHDDGRDGAASVQPFLFHPPGVIRLLTPAEETALATTRRR